MRRTLIGILVFMALTQLAFGFDHQHSKWDETLKLYRNPQGLVAYGKLKEHANSNDKLAFNAYLSELQSVSEADYKSWQAPQQKAFLINAYNALTVKLIIDHYPITSIKKIGGFMAKPWTVKFFSLLGGKIVKLDPIEHDYLRPEFKDYRIHAAVNCASKSCPILRGEAYVPEKLEAQLDEQMKLWLNDTSRNSFDETSGVIKISRIFDWYEKDFDRWGGGVREVLRRYGPPSALKAIDKKGKIEYQDYDWSLNEP